MSCANRVWCSDFLTPIGNLKLRACSNGLHEINLDEKFVKGNCMPLQNWNAERSIWKVEKHPDDLKVCVQWLTAYFNNPESCENFQYPKICYLGNSEFSGKVLKELSESKVGETLTYSQLAARVGSAGASRAVGSVMRKNNVPILVPCHRVVAATNLGSYAGTRESKLKEWLLNHEKGYN